MFAWKIITRCLKLKLLHFTAVPVVQQCSQNKELQALEKTHGFGYFEDYTDFEAEDSPHSL